jgi:hypothetical protein
MLDAIGWIATATFSASYFFKHPAALRRIQAVAACVWVIYGLAIGAFPVVAANVIVAGAASYSLWREAQGRRLRMDATADSNGNV